MDLQAVFSELYSARKKWYIIGLELKINKSDLDAIGVKNADDPEKCLRCSLSTWLQSKDSKPTWRALVNALKSPIVGLEQLSRQAERKCSANLSHLELPSVDKSQSQTQEVFRCHCGNCNLLSFIENGCSYSSKECDCNNIIILIAYDCIHGCVFYCMLQDIAPAYDTDYQACNKMETIPEGFDHTSGDKNKFLPSSPAADKLHMFHPNVGE